MKPDLKVGDIIFSEYHKEHFYILIEDLTMANDYYSFFKCFSSYDGKVLKGESSLSQLKYISEGFWEYHYWDQLNET